MEKINMKVMEILTSMKLVYTIPEGEDYIRFEVTQHNGVWAVFLTVNNKTGVLNVTGRLPVCVPPSGRLRVAELLMRVNLMLTFGSFSVDFDDGFVYFRTAGHAGVGTNLEELLRFVLTRNADTLNRFIPAIMAVAFSSVPPAAALRHYPLKPIFDFPQN